MTSNYINLKNNWEQQNLSKIANFAPRNCWKEVYEFFECYSNKYLLSHWQYQNLDLAYRGLKNFFEFC